MIRRLVMRELLAYGDSNTWGLVPGKNLKNRYPRNKRWTGILEDKLKDVRVYEEGLCGRTTVFEDELRPDRRGVDFLPVLLESHYPVDGVILMLGTNDCKTYYNASPYTIGKGVERCLAEIEKYTGFQRAIEFTLGAVHIVETSFDVDRNQSDS